MAGDVHVLTVPDAVDAVVGFPVSSTIMPARCWSGSGYWRGGGSLVAESYWDEGGGGWVEIGVYARHCCGSKFEIRGVWWSFLMRFAFYAANVVRILYSSGEVVLSAFLTLCLK